MPKGFLLVTMQPPPALEDEFNAWYEGVYIPKLMAEVPHFTACSRSVGDWNGQRLYLTDYHTTTDDMPLAIAEMRLPGRAAEIAKNSDSSVTRSSVAAASEIFPTGNVTALRNPLTPLFGGQVAEAACNEIEQQAVLAVGGRGGHRGVRRRRATH